MRLKVQDKYEAIKMRKLGLSYKEILEKVPVAKSTLSNWLKYIDYTDDEMDLLKKRMNERQNSGRLKASLTNRSKRIAREQKIFKQASIEFNSYANNPFFVAGVALYWAEGGKKSGVFQFINSDPEMIRFMIEWIESFLKIKRENLKYRLFIHLPYASENCEEFWSSLINVPVKSFYKTIYKPTAHLVKKNPIYKGCLRIHVEGIDWMRKVIAWQKLLIRYHYSGFLNKYMRP